MRLRHQPVEEARRVATTGGDRLDTVDLGDQCFVRLRVSNGRFLLTAEDVEVLVIDFRPIATDLALDARPLVWTSLSPKKTDPVTKVTLPPGVTRHVDLVRLFRETGTVQAELMVHPDPLSKIHRLTRAVRVDIQLAVVARNAGARFFSTQFSFDPDGGNALSECVRLSRVTFAYAPDQDD